MRDWSCPALPSLTCWTEGSSEGVPALPGRHHRDLQLLLVVLSNAEYVQVSLGAFLVGVVLCVSPAHYNPVLPLQPLLQVPHIELAGGQPRVSWQTDQTDAPAQLCRSVQSHQSDVVLEGSGGLEVRVFGHLTPLDGEILGRLQAPGGPAVRVPPAVLLLLH